MALAGRSSSQFYGEWLRMSLKGGDLDRGWMVSVIEIIRKTSNFKVYNNYFLAVMKKHRSFEENPIQNFEIEQEF
jgi:hypothetical protein